MIRLARADELDSLRRIEVAAGEAFRSTGMTAIADDEPLGLDALAVYQEHGRAWVATDALDRPVAYIAVDEVDQSGHIAQVTVHPSCARRRLGAALIDQAARWAASRELTALTLTTFATVPWNAPYYLRLGFHEVPEKSWTPGLRRIVADEAAAGLDRWPRVVMSRALDSSSPSAQQAFELPDLAFRQAGAHEVRPDVE